MAVDAISSSSQDRRIHYLERFYPDDDFHDLPESLVGFLEQESKRKKRWGKRQKLAKFCGLLQSEEMPVGGSSAPGQVTAAENIVFHDAAVSEKVILGSLDGDYDQDGDSAAQLGEFLKRPVRIASYAWAQGGGFAQSITPWSLYFSDTFIRRKLENYGKIRCKLHLKFLINASPFHFGSVRACYFPLGDARSNFVNSADLLPFSQVPGVYIEPQNMTSAEMVLPFVWQHNWLEITKLTDFQRMGTLKLQEYAALQSANGATSGCSILVYAWAEDVELMGPTTIGSLQSDEYAVTDGVISAPATAIANVASMVKNVPIIGDFALATEMGARAIGGIAKLFGYSNPPMIEDVQPFQPKTFHAFANVETRMPIDKLCIDPKNEVSVSPKISGVEEDDPLVITDLVTRESYVNGFTWTGAQATDALLWSAVVNPHYAFLNGGFRTMPPMTYLSPNFRFWRGSIVFKFRFIKTRFHKGRVLISYDPNGDISANPDTETITFSRVVDLEQEEEVEFAVPYKATSPLLEVVQFDTFPTTNSTAAVPGYVYNSQFYNGTITMRIQTSLTGPTTTTNVTVLTFVKAGDDFEFAGPRQLTYTTTTRDPAGVIQSEEEVISRDVLTKQDKLALITTGETICSMRPLMHRTHYVSTFTAGQYGNNFGYQVAQNVFWPIAPGVGRATLTPQGGYHAAAGGTYLYNFVQNNPIDWMLEAFVGYRGSTVLHINPVAQGNNVPQIGSLSASRFYDPIVNASQNTATLVLSASDDSTTSRFGILNFPPFSGAGTSLTNPGTQAALSVNTPQYLPHRFIPAFHTQRGTDRKSAALFNDNIQVRSGFYASAVVIDNLSWPLLDVFQSAGVDFAPFMFLCTPRVFVTTLPTA